MACKTHTKAHLHFPLLLGRVNLAKTTLVAVAEYRRARFAPSGKARPLRLSVTSPPSPADSPARTFLQPPAPHLAPLQRAREKALVSCSFWYRSNLSVRFRILTGSIRIAECRSRQCCAPSPTSARLQ